MTLTGDTLARIALDAGDLIMQVYATDFAVDRKDDSSPVTEADEKAEALILATVITLAVLYRREFISRSRRILMQSEPKITAPTKM